MIRQLAFVAVSLLSTAAALPQDKFDLVCKGHSYMASWEAVDYGEITTKLRLDVGAGKYCSAECDEIKTIAKVTPDRIILEDTTEGERFSQQYFDVNSSKLTTRSGFNGPKGWVASNESDCELKEFRGFSKVSPGEKG